MTTTFNLWDEPWIRVRDAAGTVSEVSLTQVFGDSARYQTLAGDLGSQDVAILRLLLAIIMRSIDADASDDELIDQWGQWWTTRTLPTDDVYAYRDQYRDRFDLCDPDAPFMQVGGLESTSGNYSGLPKLIADVPDGASPFSMRENSSLESLSLPEAARWLVHCQAFDSSGIKTGMKRDASTKGGKSYPTGVGLTGAMGLVIAEGVNLTETLLLNLNMVMLAEHDSVVWERPPQKAGADMAHPVPTGPADLYCWTSRRMRLIFSNEHVSDVLIANGDKVDISNRMRLEPMSAWKPKSGKKDTFVPRTHSSSRQMWRGLAPLLTRGAQATVWGGKHGYALPLMAWLATLQERGLILPGDRISLRTLGLEYKFPERSVIVGLVDDSLNVEISAITDERVVATIAHAADVADAAAVAAGDLGKDLAFVAGQYTNPSANKKLVGMLRSQGRERAYADLDMAFRQWLAGLTNGSDMPALEEQWRDQVRSRIRPVGLGLCREAGERSARGRQLGLNAAFMPGEPIDTAWCWNRFQQNLWKATEGTLINTTTADKEQS